MEVAVDTVADRLTVRFTRAEVVLGLLHYLEVPLGDLVCVEVLRDPWTAVHGVRVGSGLPGTYLLGSWWRHGHLQLVALRRDRESVRVRVRGHQFDELLLGVRHAAPLVDRLRRRGVMTAGLPAAR